MSPSASRPLLRNGVWVLPLLGLAPLLFGVDQCESECVDLDVDGYGEGCPAPDCVDTDPTVHPFQVEDCDDGQDNNCDGQVDADDLECNTVDMVPVEAGPFLRGICNGGSDPSCVAGEPGFSSTYSAPEMPMRTITLDGFWVDRYEVSVEDYAACVNAGACDTKDFASYQKYTICSYGKPGFETTPMNCVGWYGAEAYCRFAGKRLPTEAEWEKAARGEDGPSFPWGSSNASCTKANYSNATNTWCVGSTAPVNSYPAGVSVYGAYNMAGNVWEWVQDWYHPEYYDPAFPLPDFSPDHDPQGPETGTYRLIRGGSWVSSEGFIRSTFKHYYTPNTATEDLGFRCVRDLE